MAIFTLSVTLPQQAPFRYTLEAPSRQSAKRKVKDTWPGQAPYPLIEVLSCSSSRRAR